MLRFRRAPSPEDSARSATYDPYFGPIGPAKPRTLAERPRSGWLTPSGSSPQLRPPVRRQLSREAGRALEILGHAIEYLADEYANDLADKGPLGNADPRVAAIQILKGLNRAIYYSGTEAEPAFGRMKRWLGSRVSLTWSR
jgi:hypothetical protein